MSNSALSSARSAPAGRVAVVIPCFREREHILSVLDGMPRFVDYIICVDDGCPDGTGKHVEMHCEDPRVEVIYRDRNEGVGAAMVTGYRRALETDARIVVKVDGDGQMDPALMERFIAPIAAGRADYTKGNRFYRIEDVRAMPATRLVGNAAFSFMSKLSTGYWHLFDPLNGYTAIHRAVLQLLPLERLARGYFFESDMLFRLNTLRAVVIDVPMPAQYGAETSHIRTALELPRFLLGHAANLLKRIGYNYFLRDFHVASLEWILGPCLMAFGFVFGIYQWYDHYLRSEVATAGTVMLAALPLIVGVQLTLSTLQFDMSNRPSVPLHTLVDDDGS
ncbi:MAG: glycosyltransferase family 2 protein [Pseudomonadota bacterium]